ncbi:MAG: hypothetical protein EA363_07890 [Balneolaceae bacterium]|nr:MAG: hypothetical protein EA363_07890 [Balneolaceae bacterium]
MGVDVFPGRIAGSCFIAGACFLAGACFIAGACFLAGPCSPQYPHHIDGLQRCKGAGCRGYQKASNSSFFFIICRFDPSTNTPVHTWK